MKKKKREVMREWKENMNGKQEQVNKEPRKKREKKKKEGRAGFGREYKCKSIKKRSEFCRILGSKK